MLLVVLAGRLRDHGGVAVAPGFGVVGDLVVDIHDVVHLEEAQRLLIAAEKAQVAATAHEYDLVAQLQLQGAVGDQHDRLAGIGHLAQRMHQVALRSGVKPGGRLVQEEDVRVGKQLHRDAGALALSAAEGADGAVALFSQLHRGDGGGDGVLRLLGGGIFGQAQLGGIFQHVVEREVVVDDIALGDIADQLFDGIEVEVQIRAVDVNSAAGGGQVSAQGVEDGAFARAGAADDGDKL